MTASISHLQSLQELYDDIELAILFDYFQLERPSDLSALSLEVNGRVADDEEIGHVRLRGSDDGTCSEEGSLQNAVARLALQAVSRRLPQWACVRSDGEVLLGRQELPERDSDVALLPQHLFTINWADSGPGYSWPEAYYAIFIPGFDRWVVTASQDSIDAYGYTDLAIGQFEASRELSEGVRQVLIEWWGQRGSEVDFRWVDFWDEGLVDCATAEAWADEVWPLSIDDDEEDDAA